MSAISDAKMRHQASRPPPIAFEFVLLQTLPMLKCITNSSHPSPIYKVEPVLELMLLCLRVHDH